MEKESKTPIQDSFVEMDFARLSKMQKIKLFLAGIVMLIVIVPLIQNFQSVNLKFLFWDSNLSVSLLILISMFAGFIIAFIREERKILKKNKEIKLLEKKISELMKKK